MLYIVAYFLFGLGAYVCCLNFYLSFLRYPLCKLSGRECRWVSGFPLVGSLLVVLAGVVFHDAPVFFWGGMVIALLDTGGLHWLVGTMLWMYLFHRESM